MISSFNAPSLPSPLAVRECTRPRFDGNLDKLNEWLSGLRGAGVRQAGPALMMALENLRKSDLTANRRISVLSALKVPILKTCAGLPKPYQEDEGNGDKPLHGITLEQRLYRLMCLNLDQTLHQLDQQYGSLTARQVRKRDWMIRNLFRFASRQIRYGALWNIPVPAGTWRDLHELHHYLSTRRARSPWDEDKTSGTGFDHELEYKRLLLFGLAAQLKESALRSEYFIDGLEGWAVQTQLTDPLRMLGRIRLFLVEVSEDRPPRQQEGALESSFHGWVLQPPYPFIHELEDAGYGIGTFGFQPLDLAFLA
ncbi:hypothetical protein ThidrDRAFT_1211 [Thiorhodococcus drewsii AZ1]|uniref:Uncharacterized protein n=1 Tax=Thiorhodococcus drewsii AZ1 TaxID=765913 RepID=G2DZ08_9GAMM|nr:hypothetical protein [Thiorhodococcus drewsii]EGV32362.1 hypothetical protein ThidrDRAFT_1211 [Thiorhodococcus drewsii AZ1]